jgi:hypothetical protein
MKKKKLSGTRISGSTVKCISISIDEQKLPVLRLWSESIAGASMLATVYLVKWWVNVSKSEAL